MGPVELAAFILLAALLIAAWVHLFVHRRSLRRTWAIITRKPHRTRRAHAIRQFIFNLEMLWIWAPGVTAMAAAGLLGWYVVDVVGWADVIGVVLFLATGASVIVAYGVRHDQLARRMELVCPGCGVMLVEERGLEFVKTGQCPECSALVFPLHRHSPARGQLSDA